MTRLAIAAVLVVALGGVAALQPQTSAPPAAAPARWLKGNTHTHTVNSDGDSTPDEVVRWYREHGYQFLFLTDHNYLTASDGLNAVHGAADKFLVIPGEEVTMTAAAKPVHVNGLGIESFVAPPKATTVSAALQQAVDGIRQAKGVPHINHPNFRWALTIDDLRQVERTRLLEIFNGHPEVNNLGGGGVPGLEEMWDRVLSSGRLLYGIAVDDAHHFKRMGDPLASGPGRGWVMVRAAEVNARAILDALERGDFYASTGVELATYEQSATAIKLSVRTTAYSKYRIQFIGKDGRILADEPQSAATYTFQGNEGYVRAKIIESNGQLAWTQPVVMK